MFFLGRKSIELHFEPLEGDNIQSIYDDKPEVYKMQRK